MAKLHSGIEMLAPETRSDGGSREFIILRTVLALIALALGAADAWVSRATMYPDGVSYLDLGDALWRGDWHNAICGYWSLIYPAIVGCFLKVFNPSIYEEYPLVHLVNFLIYVVALICFDFFLRSFVQIQSERNQPRGGQSEMTLPLWAWYVSGYAIFVSSSLFLIATSFVSGDMAIAAIIYFVSALLIKLSEGNASWRLFAVLGIVLAVGYLTKAVMFLLAAPFILVGAFAQSDRSSSLKFTAVAFLFFAMIAGPFVLVLSFQKGRATFGDSGTINYVINVNRGQFYVPTEPDAKHPLEKLDESPESYVYASPIGGTYPLWYDPSYWHEGIHPHFNLKLQVRAIERALARCTWILFSPFLGLHITVAVLVLYLLAPSPSHCIKRLKPYWYLWMPSLAAIGLYCLVVVEYRYVGAQFCVLWIVALAGVRLPSVQPARRLIAAVVCLVAALSLAIAVHQIISEAHGEDFSQRRIATPNIPKVVSALQATGIHRGDKLALVCDWLFPSREGAYIARLARAQLIGEIRPEQFWSANDETKAKLIAVYRSAGAKALLTYRLPRAEAGWERLANSDYYVYVIH